jgi:hypothetical protein
MENETSKLRTVSEATAIFFHQAQNPSVISSRGFWQTGNRYFPVVSKNKYGSEYSKICPYKS